MNNWQKQNLAALAAQFESAQAVVVALDEVAEDRAHQLDEVKRSSAHVIVSTLFYLHKGNTNAVKAELAKDADMYRGLEMTAYINDWYAKELERSRRPVISDANAKFVELLRRSHTPEEHARLSELLK